MFMGERVTWQRRRAQQTRYLGEGEDCRNWGCAEEEAARQSVVPPPSNAQACTENGQCASGFCVDGVCCDTACMGTCMACTAAKKSQGVDGICGVIALYGDPDNECPDAACDGSGTCKSYNGVTCSSASACLSDGTPDLAVGSSNGGNVDVFINQGNGTLATKTSYAVSTAPFGIDAADFNGDGKIDIAAAGQSNYVHVLMNQGGGVFAAPVDYYLAMNCMWVTTADVNNDGKPDLAVAHGDANKVSVLLNQGNGTFPTHVEYPMFGNATNVFFADLNVDGMLDLASANGQVVSVLLNQGNGTFGARNDYLAGPSYAAVAADFNGDGKPDLAVPNYRDDLLGVLMNTCRP